jgi:hypothetical protein
MTDDYAGVGVPDFGLMPNDRLSSGLVDGVSRGGIPTWPEIRALACEVQSWRASGLTPEQAQGVGPVLLGGVCPTCKDWEWNQSDDCLIAQYGNGCDDCGGSGTTPSLAERMEALLSDLRSIPTRALLDEIRTLHSILTELREALA